MKMVDIAKQALSTKNFDLAVEIYERHIKEHGPNVDLYVGLGDSYARSGQLQKAFQAYSTAFKLGQVKVDDLNHLVNALIDALREPDGLLADAALSAAMSKKEDDFFACEICRALWTDPVTIPCGHTFCRKCLEKTQSKTCKKCDVVIQRPRCWTLKTNVLLNSIVEKCFPKELQAARLKSEGNKFFESQQFKQAIEKYSEAINNVPTDHLIASNRSYAYARLNQYAEALSDAELAVKIKPDWPKGYFRKGAALTSLGRYDEAAYAFIQCLALDPSVTSAKSSLAKALHKVLSPLAPEDVKQAKLHNMVNPNALQLMVTASYEEEPVTALKPFLTEESLQAIKQSLKISLQRDGFLTPSAASSNTPHTYQRNLAHTHDKCPSAPNSAHSSPIMPRIARCSSDADSLNCRKRSYSDLKVAESTSPVRTKPSKLPRSEIAATAGVSSELLQKDDFECSLCFRLLYLPVTTPCGHSFCRQCLDRSMDHSSMCPLCKNSLCEYLAERRQVTTEAIEMIIQTYFPDDFLERKKLQEEELCELAKMGLDKQHEIPVFVCTLAYPTVPCPLHVFEPRYRLMIRQCMESGTRQFGMCVCTEDDESRFADFGTMLEIRDVQYFPDGRSLVDTVGGRRFKVLSRGVRDGFNTATVEFLQDNHVAVHSPEAQELKTLHDEVHKEAMDWFNGLPGVPQSRITQHFGGPPALEQEILGLPNGPSWAWWLTAILPLNPRAQLAVLAMSSLKERLLALRRVLAFVQQKSSQ